MSKVKYRYNHETLSYDRITISIRERLTKWGMMFVGSIFISVGYYLIYSHFFDTPQERAMTNQLSAIRFNYQMLSQELQQFDRVLSDIQKRDDDIYRTILESEPIPASIRQAGFGGVNRYEALEGYDHSYLMIALTKHTEKIQKQLVVQSKSYDELIIKAINKEQMTLSRPAIQPVLPKFVKSVSRFGMRTNPVLGVLMPHTGMDFSANIGTDIYATGDGVIVKAERTSGGYGNMVLIDHGFGFQTLYGHMHTIGVLPGHEVKRGQIIGTVGNTGRSVGPHLHYEVLKNGRHVNPINYFYNDLSPDEYVQLLERSQESDILETW